MILDNNFWYFEQALSKSFVDMIIEICEKEKKKQAEIDVEKGNVDKAKRDCIVSWTNDQQIYNIINPFIHTANQNAGWNFEIDWNETCQYTIYNKSQFYGYHTDTFTKPYKERGENLNGKVRKLSMTLQLTDQSEYEGGDFYFKYLTPKGVVEEKVDKAKKIGTIIIFPSFVWHQVTPITKGTRKSLVCWTLGKPFK
jgi:PKHD-type hydroxylase